MVDSSTTTDGLHGRQRFPLSKKGPTRRTTVSDVPSHGRLALRVRHRTPPARGSPNWVSVGQSCKTGSSSPRGDRDGPMQLRRDRARSLAKRGSRPHAALGQRASRAMPSGVGPLPGEPPRRRPETTRGPRPAASLGPEHLRGMRHSRVTHSYHGGPEETRWRRPVRNRRSWDPFRPLPTFQEEWPSLPFVQLPSEPNNRSILRK